MKSSQIAAQLYCFRDFIQSERGLADTFRRLRGFGYEAVQIGFDTDCNGATVGSIVGMMAGQAGIESKWPDAFHNTLRTSIDGYQRVTVDELAEQTQMMIDMSVDGM